MANIRISGVLLTTSPVKVHTVTSGKVAEVIRFSLTNTDTVARAVRIWFVDAAEVGGGALDKHLIEDQQSLAVLAASETRSWTIEPHLKVNDEIHWAASAGAVVAASMDVREVDDDGHQKVKTQFLTAALVTYHTVISGKQTTIVSYTLCNTDTADRLVQINEVPDGESLGAEHRFIDHQGANVALGAGESVTWRLSNRFLDEDTTIQVKADVTSKVTFTAGIREEVLP